MVRANPAESGLITLFCKLNANSTRLYSHRVFPFLGIEGKTHASYRNDPWLRTGLKLSRLVDFYPLVRKAWDMRSDLIAGRLQRLSTGNMPVTEFNHH